MRGGIMNRNITDMTRFETLTDVVYDRQTGLMWTRSAAVSDFPLSWEEALTFIKDMNNESRFGYSDWKLPDRRELFSIVSREAVNPSLPPGHPFVDVFSGYYWTSTSCARVPDQAWYIHFGGARVFKGMKYNSYMVWPVRVADGDGKGTLPTGQHKCFDEKGLQIDCDNTGQDGEYKPETALERRFAASADVVYDRLTGLTWMKNADIGDGMIDWQSAFDTIAALNRQTAGGYDDWRLPDIVELESLIDMNRHSPALPADSPFINVSNFYWSSTTSRYDTDYAWVLYLIDGAVGVGYKTLTEFYLWPVRGEPSAWLPASSALG